MDNRFLPRLVMLVICTIVFMNAGPLQIQASSTVAPPTNLTARVTPTSIDLSWQNHAVNQTGVVIQCKMIDEFGEAVGNWGDSSWSLGPLYTSYSLAVDELPWVVTEGFTMRFRVVAIARESNLGPVASAYSDEITVRIPSLRLVYKIGQPSFLLNGAIKSIDATPVIIQGRTFLPIRHVADPLGVDASWNDIEKKVTLKAPHKTIELWINNNTAKVNGLAVKIDPNNPNVMPLTIPPGRTILPLRFIADNLDCSVYWDPQTSQVEILQ